MKFRIAVHLIYMFDSENLGLQRHALKLELVGDKDLEDGHAKCAEENLIEEP